MLNSRIDFLKPDHRALADQGYHPVDMHIHTRYSDSYTHVGHLLRKARKKGFGVAITDHNEVKGVKDALSRKSDVLIIPGMELTTFERAHLLFYFYDYHDLEAFYLKHVEKKKTANPYAFTNCHIQEIIDQGHSFNAIIAAAHPYSPSPMGIVRGIKRGYVPESVLDSLDSIEVLCGTHTMKMNLNATKLALETGKPFHGGSDAHTLMEVGKVVTYSEADEVGSFLDAIRRKKNLVMGKPTTTLMKLPAYATLSQKHLRYLRPTLKTKTVRTIKDGIAYHRPRVKAKVSTIKKRGKASLDNLSDKISG